MMAASNEPGAYLLYSTFMLITSIDSIYFMKFYPVMFSFIMLFSLYVISAKFTDSKIAIISSIIYVAFHYFIIYVYPGDLSQLFFLLFIYLFLLYMETKSMGFAYLLLLIVLSGMTIYILFPFIIILPSIILVLYYSLPYQEKKVYKLFVIIVFIFIIAWISWLTYLSQGTLRIISSIFLNAISKREIIELPVKIVSPPSMLIMTLLIKEVITAFEILSGAAVIFWGLVNIKSIKVRQRLLVLAIFFMICILGIALSALSSSLTLGAYIRFYWFSLMPFSILIPLYLLNNKKVSHPRFEKFNRALNWTFIIMLMVFLSLSPIIIHDNDPGNYYPSSCLKGADFAVKNLKGNIIWVKYHVHLIEYMALRNGILFEGYMDFQGNETTRFISLTTYIKIYGNESSNYSAVIFNDYEDSLDILSGNIDSVIQRHLYEQLVSQKLNLVFSDGCIRIYAKSK
jgi:4-amino-4-deoxy-L-arabinose transferase-like glycosyltransferase